MVGTVFNIQRFSVHDGPGIRTNVFLKGCPLRCPWCHNPEGLTASVQIKFSPAMCIGCAACVDVCGSGLHVMTEDKQHSFDMSGCVSCGSCSDVCPTGALEAVGKSMDADEIIAVAEKDRAYYGSVGGITISGGEPFFQPKFAAEILKCAKAHGLNTAVETSGFAAREAILGAVPYTDVFLFDYKLTDYEQHMNVVGVDKKVIMDNLEAVNDAGAAIILRCPIIPGVNDNTEHFDGICAAANKFDGIYRVELLPFHSYGISKWEKFGLKAPFDTEIPSKEKMAEISAYISRNCNKEVVVM